MTTKKKKVTKSKKPTKKTSSPMSKSDFETFQFGVERLKELKKELGALDTRGFAREEKDSRFEVWNDGKGLSADKAARLFGKFVRFGQDADAVRSAGLGLFITKEIINKHGGEIRVESEEGTWINFIFTLPADTPGANK